MRASRSCKTRWQVVAMCGALVLTACGNEPALEPAANPTSIATPKSKLALNPVASCTEFREYFADSLVRQLLTEYFPCWGCEVILLGRPGIGAPTALDSAAGPGAESSSFVVSDTNVQEAGVDEADLIKADSGGYFFIARGQELLVVDSVPAEQMNIVARLPVNGYARSLYLDETGQRLAVMVDGAGPHYAEAAPFPARFGSGMLFVDVSDPTAPVVTNWFWTEGYAVDSRRVADRVHLVTRYGFSTPASLSSDTDFQQLLNDYYTARSNGTEARRNELATQIEQGVRQAVTAATLAELLPLQHSGLETAAPLPLACDKVQRSELEHRLGFMLISSMDMKGAEPASLAVVNNAWRLYGSSNYLYLMQDSGGWWFDPAQTQQTVIYRYALSEGAVEPAGFGVVDGWALNSYSLGEHDGFLRVATTESRFEPEGPWSVTNHLTVLGEADDGNLETVGAVRDFVPDERIFSARFLGDRGYVVTFLQVDPLFAFDLSDPRAPRLVGQIEIPGFATYLHPLGADHLLTIGRAGDANGSTSNIRLQIFDVSDLTQPALLHFHVPPVAPGDYVFSLAEYDPHAFTYFAPAELLSIPAQIGSSDPDRSFSGFLAFNVNVTDGFTELGRVDHKSVEQGGSGCPSGGGGEGGTIVAGDEPADDVPPPECPTFAPVYYNSPLRSVVLSEPARTVLYTLSDVSIKAHDAADLTIELRSVSLAPAD